ncbi:MAG TPA: hypothetical protein VN635_12420 [Conexibacter sp.]|nr:hypothetical protein [Conexibacter sp.]
MKHRRVLGVVLAAAAIAGGVIATTAHGGDPVPVTTPTPTMPPPTLHPTAAQASATALQNAANAAQAYGAPSTGAQAQVVTGITLADAQSVLYPDEGSKGGPADTTPVTVVVLPGSFQPRSTVTDNGAPAGKYLDVVTDDETGQVLTIGIEQAAPATSRLGDVATASLPAAATNP